MEHPLAQMTSQKRAHEEDHIAFPLPKRSRIAQWIADTSLPSPTSYGSHRRARSAPDHFTGHSDLQLDYPRGGMDLTGLAAAAQIEATEATESGEAAIDFEVPSAKVSRRSLSSAANYASTLFNHHVIIEHDEQLMPVQLRTFLDQEILHGTGEDLVSEQAFEDVRKVCRELAEENKTSVARLFWSPMFCRRPPELLQGSETVWDTTALPPIPGSSSVLTAPKPDFYVGYHNLKGWSPSERMLIDHAVAQPFAMPSRRHCFPFLIVEMKSDPDGGTLTKAGFQAATGGAICVNGLRWFGDAAKKSRLLDRKANKELRDDGHAASMATELDNVEETIAFSVLLNHFIVRLYVHWYSVDEERIVMSPVRDFLPSDLQSVRRCAATMRNIYSWAAGTRKTMIKSMLQDICKSPPEWMLPGKRGPPTEQQGNAKRRQTKKSVASPSVATGSAQAQSVVAKSIVSHTDVNLMSPPKSQAAASPANNNPCAVSVQSQT